jgi:hypothetical protein
MKIIRSKLCRSACQPGSEGKFGNWAALLVRAGLIRDREEIYKRKAPAKTIAVIAVIIYFVLLTTLLFICI